MDAILNPFRLVLPHSKSLTVDNSSAVIHDHSRISIGLMRTLDEILEPLADQTYEQLKPVAVEVGLPVDTLYKIIKGYTLKPSYEAVRKIAAYLESRAA